MCDVSGLRSCCAPTVASHSADPCRNEYVNRGLLRGACRSFQKSSAGPVDKAVHASREVQVTTVLECARPFEVHKVLSASADGALHLTGSGTLSGKLSTVPHASHSHALKATEVQS